MTVYLQSVYTVDIPKKDLDLHEAVPHEVSPNPRRYEMGNDDEMICSVLPRENDLIKTLKIRSGDNGVKTLHQWQFLAQTVRYIS